MIQALIILVDFAAKILIWTLILYIILQYFLPPYHNIRETLGRILNPMLDPIRRIIPSVGMFDFSVMVLWIIINFTRNLIIGVLSNFTL